MIYTRIETIMANGNKSWMEIATEGLFEMVCPSGKKIVVPDRICNIIICDAFLVLRTEDRDFRNGRSHASFVKDNREVNNIDAFDWQGNHLWNIGEIVGDVKMAFDGITHISALEAKHEFNVACESEPYLFKCVTGGITFIIDGVSRKCLCRVMGKVK